MSLAVRLKDNLGSGNTNREPSPNVWGDCPIGSIIEGTIAGQYFFDDFADFPLIGTQTTEIAHGRYKVFANTGCAVTPVSAVDSVELGNGILDFSLDTDNDSASLAQAYPSFLLKSTSGKLWFEARLAYTPITTNGIGWFLGLAETELWTLANGVPFNAGDAITNSASAIGFRKEEDGLGVIDTVYSDRATSFTNIGDAAASVSEAYEFIKLGMRFDPTAAAADRVKFYANNLELATSLSAASLTALTNLDANALGLLFAVVADSAGTSGHAYLDWWRCAQLG
jgi:hypothetical protein